jgi:hypothetical protein
MIDEQAVIEQYNKVGKKGKPHGNEWTVLAGIVLAKEEELVTLEVVSLGTGNKCLGDSKRTPDGDVVRDSVGCLLPLLTCKHAEIISRRALLKFLYLQLREWLYQRDSIFVQYPDSPKLHLKTGHSFHLYVSQNLCTLFFVVVNSQKVVTRPYILLRWTSGLAASRSQDKSLRNTLTGQLLVFLDSSLEGIVKDEINSPTQAQKNATCRPAQPTRWS